MRGVNPQLLYLFRFCCFAATTIVVLLQYCCYCFCAIKCFKVKLLIDMNACLIDPSNNWFRVRTLQSLRFFFTKRKALNGRINLLLESVVPWNMGSIAYYGFYMVIFSIKIYVHTYLHNNAIKRHFSAIENVFIFINEVRIKIQFEIKKNNR